MPKDKEQIKAYRRQYREQHWEEILKKKAEYREKNKEKISASNRKRRYQITQRDFEAILAEQGNRCRGCQTLEPVNGKWHVDHDEKTGLVRGILCPNCNLALGLLKHDTWTLVNLIDHLEGFEAGRHRRLIRRAVEGGNASLYALEEYYAMEGELP